MSSRSWPGSPSDRRDTGWWRTGGVYILYLLGFGFLLFLAGQEIEVARFRGPAFRVTGASFAVSLIVAVPVAFLLRLIAHGAEVRLLAMAMTASSLGVMVPVLRDAGSQRTDFGQLAISGRVGRRVRRAAAARAVLFSAQPGATWEQVAYVAALGAAAVIGAIGLRRLWLRRHGCSAPAEHRPDDSAAAKVRDAFVILGGPPSRTSSASTLC